MFRRGGFDMKKLLLSLLLLSTPLFALPIGNPIDASLYSNSLMWGDYYSTDRRSDLCDPYFNWCDAWNFRLGFDGDYVFDRHMEIDSNGKRDIDHFEIFTNAGFLAMNICDRFDIFGTLGASNIYLRANPMIMGENGSKVLELWTETTFSWSVGSRLTLWNCDCWYFGIEGQYFYTKPDVEFVQSDHVFAYPDNEINMKYTEWQVGVGISYLLRVSGSGLSVIPYTALKWAGSKAHFNKRIPDPDEELTLVDLDNDKTWGYALGTTLLFCNALSLTVEGRWGDEKAFHINGQINF